METLIQLCKCGMLEVISPSIISVRTAATKSIKAISFMRGLPPYKAKPLSQKLEEAAYKDPNVYYKVNIGLPQTVISRTSSLEQWKHLKETKKDLELEKKARENRHFVNLEDVTEEWMKENASAHIKAAAEHYGIYQDLFGDAFFYPQINLDVAFKHTNGLIPVYRGNLIKPFQAENAPVVTYDADPDSLWTLVVSNPDGHLHEENAEYLHWLVCNIPGNDVNKGEVITDYIQPFPARGTGFQRFVFILYKQTEKVNLSSMKIPSKDVQLSDRTFRTYDFYRKYEDQLTPGGLAFCQVDWDSSVSQFFHTVLNMDEPVYEYDFAPHYHKKQKMFPIKQPFNLYMDRYRDPKQIAKEYLLKKLKNRHPFEAPKPPLRFPNTMPITHDIDEKLYGRIPSWLKREKLKERLGYGRINDY